MLQLLKPCNVPGCTALVEEGRCDTHVMKKQSNPSGKKSSSVKAWLNSARYRNTRKLFLQGRLCVYCKERDGVLTPAVVLDHIQPHKGDACSFWDQSNWQGLCESCHNSKTATYDGGFGNG